MQLEAYFDILSPDDIRIHGHSIGIESVLYEYVHRSRTPEQIAECFPTRALDEIYATILVPAPPRATGLSGRLIAVVSGLLMAHASGGRANLDRWRPMISQQTYRSSRNGNGRELFERYMVPAGFAPWPAVLLEVPALGL